MRVNKVACLAVQDMDRVVGFWEKLLESKVTERSSDPRANFDDAGVYIGPYRPGFDGREIAFGDNVMPAGVSSVTSLIARI